VKHKTVPKIIRSKIAIPSAYYIQKRKDCKGKDRIWNASRKTIDVQK
jgi:hypothetical protein